MKIRHKIVKSKRNMLKDMKIILSITTILMLSVITVSGGQISAVVDNQSLHISRRQLEWLEVFKCEW